MDAGQANRLLSIAKAVQSLAPLPDTPLATPRCAQALFDQLVTEPELVDACRQLYRDGH
jgi:hypothetical protein